jgi:hypothetical protein
MAHKRKPFSVEEHRARWAARKKKQSEEIKNRKDRARRERDLVRYREAMDAAAPHRNEMRRGQT